MKAHIIGLKHDVYLPNYKSTYSRFLCKSSQINQSQKWMNKSPRINPPIYIHNIKSVFPCYTKFAQSITSSSKTWNYPLEKVLYLSVLISLSTQRKNFKIRLQQTQALTPPTGWCLVILCTHTYNTHTLCTAAKHIETLSPSLSSPWK